MAQLNFTFGIPAGADGKSAYQIWLDAGNTGTEQDFLDSIAASAAAEITASATVTSLAAGADPTVIVTVS